MNQILAVANSWYVGVIVAALFAVQYVFQRVGIKSKLFNRVLSVVNAVVTVTWLLAMVK